MTAYTYRAYDADGRLVEGQLDSDTREAALDTLRRRGALPIEIAEGSAAVHSAGSWRDTLGGTRRRPRSDPALALATRELATLLGADLPLDEALRLLALQPSLPARMRRLFDDVLARVLAGASLSDALSAHPREIPELHWRLVAAGERSGNLAGTLGALAGFLERGVALRGKVRDALLYPMVLLAAAVVALAIVVGVLVPAIAPLFDEAGATPPPVIATLAAIQRFAAAHWPLLVIGAGLLVALLAAATRNAQLQRAFDGLALAVPVLGTLIARRETARLTGTLATLLASGVPMLDAMRVATDALSNTRYRQASGQIVERLASGGLLSAELAATGLFSELALRMTAIGERTGDIDGMLARLARIEEEALQRDLERMAALVAPLLTVLIGLFVGGIILSVMDAILGLNELAIR